MKAKKSYGQYFLQDKRVVEQILNAASLSIDDTIIEIGPGLGALTFPLSKRVKKILAIEADPELSHKLREKLPSNVTLITGNALDVDWTIEVERYAIVANLPYSITSPFLRKCLQLSKKPDSMTIMIQKEVGERLLAQPGESERGFLTLLCESQATIEKICTVSPSAFQPQPGVDSMVVRLILREDRTPTIYWPLVEAGFRHKRQMLANAITADLKLPRVEVQAMLRQSGVSVMARPSDLTFEQWQIISKGFLKR